MSHANYKTLPSGNSSRLCAIEVPRWKRMLDIVCILMALPLLVPLSVLLTILIKIGSAGPVLFRQERVGYLGHRFMCLKFRTMLTGADTGVHQVHYVRLMGSNLPMEKMDVQGDPRLIPLGWWLRASGLDELPQIINVLRGEMSLVGPRPCLAYEYDRYLPWQKQRFATVPGLTGLWQVSGKNKTTFEEMIHLDVRYARTQALWLDLTIMLRTVPTLIWEVWETHGRRKLFVRPGSSGDNPLSPNNQTIVLPQQFLSRVDEPSRESVVQEVVWQRK